MTSTYLGYRLYANDINKALQRTAAEPTAAREQKYYLANIGKVTSVDQFVNDYKLFNYAMKAFGLSDLGNAKALMKKVLQSDLTDSKSFANSLSDTRYRNFAKAFQFDTKGIVASTAQIQTAAQQNDTTTRFASSSTASATDQAAATAYFKANIGKVTSVDALEKDEQLYDYIRTAYGIEDTISDDTFTKALESDLSDRSSFAFASNDDDLVSLAQNFNFSKDGKVANQRQIQSNATITATIAAYNATIGTGTAAKAAAQTEADYYKAITPLATSVDSFLNDSRLVAFAKKAYGIPASTGTAQLKAVLTSDLNNSKSVANKLGGSYRDFAAAFNVTTNGTIARAPNVEPQSKAALTNITDAYLEQTMETEAGEQNEGVRLALNFRRLAPTITSAYQILGDKALTKVVQTVLGLSANSSKADIDSQARNITKRLNIVDFQDPKKLDKLVARFAALYDLTNTSTSSNTSLALLL